MDMMNKRDCPFCKMARHEIPAVVVQEDEEVMAIMDLYPATTGHILVLPKQHIEDIYAMPAELVSCIMMTAITVAKAINQKLSPDGLNLIQSNKVAAGQTISHFHLHIVPRYCNDPVVLRFGHGSAPEDVKTLEKTASLLRSELVSE